MKEELKKETEICFTENGAPAYLTSGSALVDLFSCIGALRDADEREIIERFSGAFAQNSTLALKILFFARDVREGLGERRVFCILLNYLARQAPETVLKNMKLIAGYGRYDDLLSLLHTPCEAAVLEYIVDTLIEDDGKDSPSLLAKWLPSVNASSKKTVQNACYLAAKLGMSKAGYRKWLSALRAKIGILENSLRKRAYTFDYSKQPSRAMMKYQQAFLRNDRARYEAFLGSVARGEAKLHTGTLYPYDVVRACLSGSVLSKERKAGLDVTWNELKRELQADDRALAVVDGSGSMYGSGNPLPIETAVSLGILFAESCKDAFSNCFITFSQHPKLIKIKGKDIYQKTRNVMEHNECLNTDLTKVFDLILRTALKRKLSREELPRTLYILSDMEFDRCVENAELTSFEYAKRKYAKNGYKLPEIVFWNLQSRQKQVPVKKNEQGVTLVSGASAKLFSLVAKNETNPLEFMLEILNSQRYKDISA